MDDLQEVEGSKFLTPLDLHFTAQGVPVTAHVGATVQHVCLSLAIRKYWRRHIWSLSIRKDEGWCLHGCDDWISYRREALHVRLYTSVRNVSKKLVYGVQREKQNRKEKETNFVLIPSFLRMFPDATACSQG